MVYLDSSLDTSWWLNNTVFIVKWDTEHLTKVRDGFEIALKEWQCVQVGHHKNVGKTIEEWQKNGWRLHTYQAMGTPTLANHYLLFEKGE